MEFEIPQRRSPKKPRQKTTAPCTIVVPDYSDREDAKTWESIKMQNQEEKQANQTAENKKETIRKVFKRELERQHGQRPKRKRISKPNRKSTLKRYGDEVLEQQRRFYKPAPVEPEPEPELVHQVNGNQVEPVDMVNYFEQHEKAEIIKDEKSGYVKIKFAH